MAVENIGKRDLIWAMLATLFRIGSGVLLFPMVLSMLPSETVGVWTIFTSVTLITGILDFGFNQSFARNISYVFSGVRSLKRDGHEYVADADKEYILTLETQITYINVGRHIYTCKMTDVHRTIRIGKSRCHKGSFEFLFHFVYILSFDSASRLNYNLQK